MRLACTHEQEAETPCEPEGEEEAVDDSDDPLLEDGDRLFAMSLPPESEFINASSNISQCLAEAFACNSKIPPSQSVHDSIPPHFHDFEDVFSKASFDTLPEKRSWDHTIKLIPDATPTNCKVYPLSLNEQKELDDFL